MYRDKLLGPAEATPLSYISSMERDKLIACETLEVVKAHLKGLIEAGIIEKELAQAIEYELGKLQEDPSPLWAEKATDVHEALELYLVRKFGMKASNLALGRSRNDQVAGALRLKTKTLIIQVLVEIAELRRTLLNLASAHLKTVMPVYTHERPAQVSTLAHYLTHIDEMLEDYELVLESILKVIDKSPLGSGPAAGSMTPLDRSLVGRQAFKDLVFNTLYATSGREFLVLSAAVAASLLVSLSRIAEDLIYFSSPDVDFIDLPNSHLDTSSIMPHKRNPVTLEIIRARAGIAIGRLAGAMTVSKALRTGYNLDLQEVNSEALSILIDARDALSILRDLISKIEIKEDAMKRYTMKYNPIAAEVAEAIALKSGKPFREVYWEIAETIKEYGDVNSALEKIGERYGLQTSIDFSLKKTTIGSPNPDQMRVYVNERIERVTSKISGLKIILDKIKCR